MASATPRRARQPLQRSSDRRQGSAQEPAPRARFSPRALRRPTVLPQMAPAIGRGCEAELAREPSTPSGVGDRGRTRWETDLRSCGKDLEEEPSPGRSGSPRSAMAEEHTRPDDGARPRSRPSRSSHPDERGTGNGTAGSEAVIRANGKGATAAVTRNGCRRGVLRGARILRCGEASPITGLRIGRDEAETRRTPGPAAGCNKPATPGAEEAAEVVRNHKGGTGLRGWNPRGRSDDRPSSREWTLQEHVGGGATGASPGTRAGPCGREPREGRFRPGRSVWLRSGA